MMPSPRPRSTRHALAGLQYALGTVAPPNPLVFAWRWRYELILGIGLPAALIVLGGISIMLSTLTALTVLTGAALLWAPARRHLIARAWCIITPHRVRVGCAEAWIHSRRGKIPIVLLTTRQPFGERVHLWCRAGTSAIDFISAAPLMTAACWARGIRVGGNERFAQLITLEVIRHVPPDQPDNLQAGHPRDIGLGHLSRHVPRTPADRPDGPRPYPDPPGRQDVGPAAWTGLAHVWLFRPRRCRCLPAGFPGHG
jgi:hypothetical protein